MKHDGFPGFQSELGRLVTQFQKHAAQYKSTAYDEASLRQEFLNPLFRSLGWDVENKAGAIPSKREVEIESRTQIGGGQKRADYLFRTDGIDRFVCEAKKPAEELHARYAFQAKRYAWNKDLPLAVLTDFEEIKVYVVGGKPHHDEPDIGHWKTWHFLQYPLVAQEMWDLLARERVGSGSIDKLIESLPKRPVGKGKARQAWLFKPDRSRSLDNDFLEFLDEARHGLASDIFRENDRKTLEGTKLNEAVQRILDRILFLRICEDRDIDTGKRLSSIVDNWRDGKPTEAGSLWRALVRHFRELDRRPPSLVPFFNGNLFKPHFSEDLSVDDEWLIDFIGDLSDEESPYLFNVIPVEILGSIYERFLGKVVRPQGRGITVEEKPEVRKAGGVYYTPRYIVNYIVEQAVGKQLDEITEPQLKDFQKRTNALRVLDMACGSGSFLIRAFDRVCEHWQGWLTRQRPNAQDKVAREAFDKKHRSLCWIDAETGDIHLTVALKRKILTNNIYGVDLDGGAVEVTQLSLYLKMLEHENRTTLDRERELFPEAVALLPPLEDNIKRGNSLIASDFSMMPEDLVRVHAFDWPVQFENIMKAGGFDAVIGNPPYIRIQTMQETDAEAVNYLNQNYAAAKKGNYDIYVCFVERGLKLINQSGTLGFILPHKFTNSEYGQPLRTRISTGKNLSELVHFGANQVFEGATTYTCLMFLRRAPQNNFRFVRVDDLKEWEKTRAAIDAEVKAEKVSAESWSFSVGKGAALVDRLRGHSPRLGDAADIFVGLQTSADDVLVLEFVQKRGALLQLKSKSLEQEVELEKEFLHPLVSGTDIQGYDSFNGRQFILFPYSVTDEQATLIPFAEIKRRAPKTAKYLAENRRRLEGRERGKFADSEWYRFGRSQNLGIQERKKVCV